MRQDATIVIVGGGPAGLSTALFLAHLRPSLRGRMVVLERERYPREKPCAGGLGRRGDRVLGRIGVVVDVPSVDVREIAMTLPDGEVSARAAAPIGRVVRRIEHDAELAEQARRRGIAVREGVKVTGVEPDPGGVTVHTDQGSLRASVVVGADGVGSVVRRSMGLGAGSWRAQVLEVDTEPSDRDRARDVLAFDASDRALAGYFWHFPTIVEGRELVCRGVYQLRLPGDPGLDLTEALEGRLSRLGLSLARCKKKRYAERGFDPAEPCAAPRRLLVGEAAGVDPITGEGIAQALQYGEVAAGYLLDRLDAGDVSFADWRPHLYRTELGRDMLIRHVICQRYNSPLRPHLERVVAGLPEIMQVGARYFAGDETDVPMLAAVLARAGARLLSATLGGGRAVAAG